MPDLRVKSLAAACLLSALVVSCGKPDLPEGLYARLDTSKGDIVIGLEYGKAPLTTGNFVGLAEGKLDASRGKRFFDGLVFHRVEPGFVIQTGDPLGNGSGGPGYEFPNEISDGLKYDSEGIVGMANAGPDTNGSQFFVTLRAAPELDGGYSIFGKVVRGMEVVRRIERGDRLAKVEILRVGSAAKAFKVDQMAWNARCAPLVAALRKAEEEKRAADIATIRRKWPDLVPNAEGVFRKTVRASAGESPKAGQTAQVRYKGMLLGGQIFDQSDLHGGIVDFQVGAGRIIPGLDKALLTMRKGEKIMIVIPPELAYGARGTPGGPIPPDSFLAFEIELVGIK
jgi:peptidyl-prolyl cis-trans isomerase A (cyclophilin A)